jgi:hypothetical protein
MVEAVAEAAASRMPPWKKRVGRRPSAEADVRDAAIREAQQAIEAAALRAQHAEQERSAAEAADARNAAAEARRLNEAAAPASTR